ncbi:MAG: hypothetical protein SNG35_01980 [Rikenellaceae bacterium]
MRLLSIISAAALLLTITAAEAKIKVVDSSEKRVPVWVNDAQSDYIITQSIRGDIESAKDECIRNVRDQIINSVAQNVITSNSNLLGQRTENGKTEMIDSFVSMSEAQSANLPFLKGISMTKVEQSYWEKRVESDTNEVTYLYTIMYPFSKGELESIIAEFERRDREIQSKYDQLAKDFANITSVVDVDRAIAELDNMEAYFFDKVRLTSAVTLRDNYRAVYRLISIREVSNELGEYRFEFIYNNRPIEVSSKPKVTSKTLSEMRVEPEGSCWCVYYNYDACDPDEMNQATITSYVGGNRLTQMLYADLKGATISIRPADKINLRGVLTGDQSVENLEIRLFVDCDLSQTVRVYQITLNIPSLSSPIFMDGIEIDINGKGRKSLVINHKEKIGIAKSQSGRLGLASGELNIMDSKGTSRQIKLSLPYSCNW